MNEQASFTSFAQWYQACFPQVYRHLYAQCGHCEQAEDLIQEVFVKDWQRLPVRQRELLLSRAEGDTLAQLARKEGCHRSKIMRRLVHARATLRHHSRQVGGEA